MFHFEAEFVSISEIQNSECKVTFLVDESEITEMAISEADLCKLAVFAADRALKNVNLERKKE